MSTQTHETTDLQQELDELRAENERLLDELARLKNAAWGFIKLRIAVRLDALYAALGATPPGEKLIDPYITPDKEA